VVPVAPCLLLPYPTPACPRSLRARAPSPWCRRPRGRPHGTPVAARGTRRPGRISRWAPAAPGPVSSPTRPGTPQPPTDRPDGRKR